MLVLGLFVFCSLLSLCCCVVDDFCCICIVFVLNNFVVSYLIFVFVFVRLLIAIVTMLFYVFVFVVQRVYLCCDVCFPPRSGRALVLFCCVVFECLCWPFKNVVCSCLCVVLLVFVR